MELFAGLPRHRGSDGRRRGYSERSAEVIDEEVLRLVGDARQRATAVLTTRRTALDRIVGALVEKETLGTEELAVLTGAVATVTGAGPAHRPPLPVAAPEGAVGWRPSTG